MIEYTGLTRNQYEIIRTSDKKLWPSYGIIQIAKKDCYPNPESYVVTETSAEINLQDLLNHTTTRLILYLEEVLQTLTTSEGASMVLFTKWGCDGSKQTQIMQKFEDISDSDSNIFQSSMVPLRLVCKTNNRVIWQNPTPSSPRYCRPIRIRFVKESSDITRNEIRYKKIKSNYWNQRTILM